MIKTLKAALSKAVNWLKALVRPAVIMQQVLRQVFYIQRLALKQRCVKPGRCSAEALKAAGQIELF